MSGEAQPGLKGVAVLSQMENTYSVKGSGGQTFEGGAGKVVSGDKPESSMDNPLAQGNGRESPSGEAVDT